MPELYIPESDDKAEDKITVNYEPTQEDEEKFLLMYFLNVQPSEIDFNLKDEERRRWVIGRFMMQKQMEQQAMAERRATMQMAQGLDLSNLKQR